MKSHFFPVLGICLILAACSGVGREYMLKVKPLKLTANTMYDEKMVYDVIFDAEEQNVDSLKSKSRALFMQGLDLYKNKNKPGSAIGKFKASILVFPDAKTYYELGNALLDSHLGVESREEAMKAYEVAEHLQFQPMAQISFKKACIQYSNGDEYAAIWSLRDAFNNGMFDTIAVAHNQWLKGITIKNRYRSMVTDVLAGRIKDDANGLFELYKKAFKLDAEQFVIGPENVDMSAYGESISYDFASFIPEMENTAFGRDVSHDYFYVGRVKETADYIALLYSSVSFWGGEMQPTITTLVVYDQQGKVISKKPVACQCSAEKIKTCTIDNGTIVVEDFKRNWEYTITEVPFEENKITGYESLAKATFRIDDSGMIVGEDVPANYNDSSIFAQQK